MTTERSRVFRFFCFVIPSFFVIRAASFLRYRANRKTLRAGDDRRAKPEAFTVLELLIVITIIIVVAGLILATTGYVQKKGARSRAEAEIAAMSAALENYKADNGIYPQYNGATGGHALYQSLSGDGNDAIGGVPPIGSTGLPGSSGKSYMTLKNNMLRPNPPDATTRVVDPFGNDYGYRIPPGTNNPTFDLWSTANANPPSDQNQWIKNW